MLEERNRKWLIAAVVVTLIGFVGGFMVFGGGTTGALLAVPLALILGTAVLMVMVAWNAREDRRNGFAVVDERSTLIEGKAGRLAFMVGNYGMLALMWYVFLVNVLNLGWVIPETERALIMALLFQTGVYFFGRWWYGSKP
jgi:hypothetical protein